MTENTASPAAWAAADAPDQLAGAQYFIDGVGAVTLNQAGAALTDARRWMDRLGETLDRSYVGATWASLLVRHPWLRQLRVRLWAEHEYDDEGGAYLSYYNSVSHVAVEPSRCVPEVLCIDEQADHELIEDYVSDEISAFDGDAFRCLGLSAAGAEVTYIISRSELDELVARVPFAVRMLSPCCSPAGSQRIPATPVECLTGPLRPPPTPHISSEVRGGFFEPESGYDDAMLSNRA